VLGQQAFFSNVLASRGAGINAQCPHLCAMFMLCIGEILRVTGLTMLCT
jgi:hypothetical protein